MTSSFTHLHVHSNYSLCRGGNTIDSLCRRAAEFGMKSMALTDTNGLYGLKWFINTAKSYKLDPIIGVYLQTEKYDCIMLAKNIKGYHYLSGAVTRLHSSESDFEQYLSSYHDVIIITNNSYLLNYFTENNLNRDIFVELVSFQNSRSLIKYAKENNFPVVATNSVYFLNPEDWETHQLLRAIDLNTSQSSLPDDQIVSKEAYLKSSNQMWDLFSHVSEAVENTQKIADQCRFNLDFKNFIFTSIRGEKGETAFELLEERVKYGIIWRYGNMTGAIKKRYDYEMEIIRQKNFAPYFLVVQDIVEQAPRTCGRGSAAASLVSYCLGITHVDPIKYDLFFDRFLNPGRIDPPDIDVDFPWDERDQILDYIFTKYGTECTAMISNHNSFKARSAVREIAKVYGMPENEISSVTKKLGFFWQPDNIWEITQSHPVYKNTFLDQPWPEIIAQAEKIRGFPRHLSIHCGGVIIAPDGIERYVPTQPAKKILRSLQKDSLVDIPQVLYGENKINVIQWEKDQAEEMGLIKLDILGNRSLAVIRDTLQSISDNYNVKIDYAQWNPLNDPKTLSMLAQGDTIGVFYVESPAMRLLQKKTGQGDFEHLVIHSSIIRPAANEYINEYIRRLKGGTYDPLHPLLHNILAETYGIMVYQEDVSKVVMALADFSAAEADDLRKVISKKHKVKKVLDYKNKFFQGCKVKHIPDDTIQKIWNMIMSFSGYSFCKPHSASYALVSFKSAYLRAHYPTEFLASVISNQGGYYSTFAYISEARRMCISVLMPDINKSAFYYTGYQNEIRVGFMQLKGISSKTIYAVLNERKKNGVFTSFANFLSRVTIPVVDFTILIKAGCFDELEPEKSRPELIWQVHIHHGRKKTAQKQASLFEVDAEPMSLPKPQNYEDKIIWQHEIDTLGFLLSRHPLDLYREKLKNVSYVSGQDLHKYINKKVKTIGWLITRKTTSTKKSQLMEFISFEDTTAIYETVFFPKTYKRFVYLLTRSRPYLLSGIVHEQHGAITLHVERVDLV